MPTDTTSASPRQAKFQQRLETWREKVNYPEDGFEWPMSTSQVLTFCVLIGYRITAKGIDNAIHRGKILGPETRKQQRQWQVENLTSLIAWLETSRAWSSRGPMVSKLTVSEFLYQLAQESRLGAEIFEDDRQRILTGTTPDDLLTLMIDETSESGRAAIAVALRVHLEDLEYEET